MALLLKSSKQLSVEELVRKMLYYRLSIILVVVFASSLAAGILLRMPMMLVLMLLAILVYALYTGYIEYLSRNNKLIYVQVVCINAKKEIKISVKPVYTYYFQGIGKDTGVSFSLNRTEELGFAQNVAYLFCFKNSDNQIDNSSLVHYIEINKLNAGPDATIDSVEFSNPRQEALKRVQASRKMAKEMPAATGKTEKTNLVEVDFSTSGNTEGE